MNSDKDSCIRIFIVRFLRPSLLRWWFQPININVIRITRGRRKAEPLGSPPPPYKGPRFASLSSLPTNSSFDEIELQTNENLFPITFNKKRQSRSLSLQLKMSPPSTCCGKSGEGCACGTHHLSLSACFHLTNDN